MSRHSSGGVAPAIVKVSLTGKINEFKLNSPARTIALGDFLAALMKGSRIGEIVRESLTIGGWVSKRKQRASSPNHSRKKRNMENSHSKLAVEESVQAVDFTVGQNFGE